MHPIIAQLRDLRTKRGVTQKEIAEMIGYSTNEVYNQEAGRHKLYVAFAEDYANALGHELRLCPKDRGEK